jgi:hypothetical protein
MFLSWEQSFGLSIEWQYAFKHDLKLECFRGTTILHRTDGLNPFFETTGMNFLNKSVRDAACL